jgi:hypothetical protein
VQGRLHTSYPEEKGNEKGIEKRRAAAAHNQEAIRRREFG